MAKGLNKVMLIGNIGQDPELKTMPNGSAVVTLSVATTDHWKDKNTGQKQERTEWHRVVVFGRTAEVCADFLNKGSKVYIEGNLRTREWEKDGQKRWTTEIICKDMQMLDNRGQGNEGRLNDNGSQQSLSAPPQPPVDDFDPDIPF